MQVLIFIKGDILHKIRLTNCLTKTLIDVLLSIIKKIQIESQKF